MKATTKVWINPVNRSDSSEHQGIFKVLEFHPFPEPGNPHLHLWNDHKIVVVLIENEDGTLTDNVWVRAEDINGQIPIEYMTTKEQVLQASTVEGMVVKLPAGQLDRKLYQEVAAALNLIGGKWKGGKVSGFVFETDPTDLLAQIANGEKRNLKKEFQFFATPAHVADELVILANINSNHKILEPSAGRGAIVDAIGRKINIRKPNLIHVFELMDINISFLEKRNVISFQGKDFTLMKPQVTEGVDDRYDRIIANPPFSKNQDIEHIYKMWEFLKPGGRIVTIASNHWRFASGKKELAFRQWIADTHAELHEVEAGAFKESGTNISVCILIIDKSSEND